MVNLITPDNVVAEWYDDTKNGTGVSVYQDGDLLATLYYVEPRFFSVGDGEAFDIIDAVRFIQSKIK